MPIFRCSQCNCAENTAVSRHATRAKGSPALCSECDPKIGKWHGRFPKMSADQFVEDKNGYLISHEEKAQEDKAAEVVEGAKKLMHLGPEAMAKHFFIMGWTFSRIWHEQNQKSKKE
jgi:hypothetical protein